MKYLLAIYLLSISAVSFAKEDCDPSSIGVTDSSSEIERYFYTGTCHYRNKDYSLSVKNWESLALLEAGSASMKSLRLMSLIILDI